MKTTYKNLIHEWFANLDKGYAEPPYTAKELAVLESLMQKYRIIEDEDSEKQKDSNTEPSETEQAPDTRFRAKSAPYMQSAEAFEEFLTSKYSRGVNIDGVGEMFKKLSTLSPSAFQSVVKIINSGTNRTTNNGTFKMGKYEKMLFILITKMLKLSQGLPENLFLAIIYGGRIVASKSQLENRTGIDIEFDQSPGIVSRRFNSKEIFEFAELSSDTMQILLSVQQLADIVTAADLKKVMNRDTLNSVFKTVNDPSTAEELERLSTESETSDVEAVNKIGKSVKQILDGQSASDIVTEFLKSYNSDITKSVSDIGYWATTDSSNYMVYLEPTSDIIDIVKANTETSRLPKAFRNIAMNKVIISSYSIDKLLKA